MNDLDFLESMLYSKDVGHSQPMTPSKRIKLKPVTWVYTDTPPKHLRKELLWCEKRRGK